MRHRHFTLGRGGSEPGRRPGPRAAGFTLIELMAVVLIFGLLASLALPGLGSRTSRELRDQANSLAADFELARQRAVVLGVPHRMLLDLDERVWRLEWEVPPPSAVEPAPGSAPPPVPMAAPARAAGAFEPVPIAQGRLSRLGRDLWFAEVETPEGVFQRGVVSIRFEDDGTADATRVVLAEPGGSALVLELLPLADAVLVADAD